MNGSPPTPATIQAQVAKIQGLGAHQPWEGLPPSMDHRTNSALTFLYFLFEYSQLTYTYAVLRVVSSKSQEDVITSSTLQAHIHDMLVSFDICVGVVLT